MIPVRSTQNVQEREKMVRGRNCVGRQRSFFIMYDLVTETPDVTAVAQRYLFGEL